MFKSFLKKAVVYLITQEARYVLRKYKPRIIAVTGSVGKTSTKDAIFQVFSSRGFVRKSEKSFNSDIGVPLTILGVSNAWNNPVAWIKNIVEGFFLVVFPRRYPEWLVLEVGADRPGDIKRIAEWLKPDIVVVTRFAPVPVHVEFFGTAEAVIREKSELVRALKEDGALILSADDDDVMGLKDLARKVKITTFGLSRAADVSASKIKITYEGRLLSRHPSGTAFSLNKEKQNVEIALKGSVGRQIIYASLAASAVGLTVGLKISDVAADLNKHEGPPGRMRLIEGIKHTTIIDDSYNSSPVAAREALDALNSLTLKGRKVAVLGDMLELGRFSVQEHKAIGAYAAVRADKLITVGVRSRDTADGALDVGFSEENIMQFDDARTAGKVLEGFIAPGDVILIKGSQGIRMERAVEEIMAHPEDKEELLVRQDREWQSR